MRKSRRSDALAELGLTFDRYAGWIGTVAASHAAPGDSEQSPQPALEEVGTRLAAIAGTSTCHIAQSKDGILVPG